MMQDAGRRAVLEAAVVRDDAVLGPKLQVLSVKGSQPGFIASMPVYRKGKQVAWVNANFHAQAFMEGMLGKGDGALSFEVFDGADNDPHSLLYATAGLPAAEASGFPVTGGRGGLIGRATCRERGGA